MNVYRVLIFLGSAFVAILLAALIAPRFIDWTDYKERFEYELSRATGWPVRLQGEVQVRLFPLPRISFSEASIGNYPDGAAIVTAERFSAEMELAPLLRGEARIVEATLSSPRFLIRRMESASIFTASERSRKPPFGAERVILDRLAVEGGEIAIEGEDGKIRGIADGIEAEIAAKALSGPWRIQATARIGESPASLDVSTGRLREDGAIGVRATIRFEEMNRRLSLSGTLSPLEEGPIWRGEFEAGPSASPSGAEADAKQASLFEGARASGSFSASAGRIDIPSYRLEIGEPNDPYLLDGEGEILFEREPSFRLSAVGRPVDFDRLEPDSEEAERKGILSSGFDPQALLRRVLGGLESPRIQGEIGISLPAILAGGAPVRDVRAALRSGGRDWRIEELQATLPGRTLFKLDGRLEAGEELGFAGRLSLESEQPGGLSEWLFGDSETPTRTFRSAGFSAEAVLTPNQLNLQGLELRFDDSLLRGSLRRLPERNARPAIIARLEGEAIDIGELMGLRVLAEGGGEKTSRHDFDVTLSSASMSAAGMEAKDARLRFRVSDGKLWIGDFEADDFYGARVRGSGDLSDALGEPNGGLFFSVEASGAVALAELIRERIATNPILDALASDSSLSEGVGLSVRIESKRSGAERISAILSAQGEIGGTRIRLDEKIQGNPFDWRKASHDLAVSAESWKAETLLRQLGIEIADSPGEEIGSMSLSLEASGIPSESMEAYVSFTSPTAELSAEGFAVALAGANPPPKAEAGDELNLSAKAEMIDSAGAELNLSGGAETTGSAAARSADAEIADSAQAETSLSAGGGVGAEAGAEAESEAGAQSPRLDFNVSISSGDVDPWLSLAGLERAFQPERSESDRPLSMRFLLASESGVHRLGNLQGRFDGIPFSGGLRLESPQEARSAETFLSARPRLEGRLAFDSLSASFLAGIALGPEAVASVGEAFSTPLPEDFDARLDVSADSLRLDGFGWLRETPQAEILDFSASLIRSGDSLALRYIDGDFLGGEVHGSLRLGNEGGVADLDARLGLREVEARRLTALTGHAEAVSGLLDADFRAEAQGRSFKGLLSGLSGSGEAVLRGVRLEGIRTGGLHEILEESDSPGFELSSGSLRSLASRSALKGEFVADEVASSFFIESGRLLVRDLSARDENGILRVEALYDPASGEAEAVAVLEPDPVPGSSAGAIPSMRFSWKGTPDALSREVDASGMEGYLALRLYEIEERRVEILEEEVAERRRLRREIKELEARIKALRNPEAEAEAEAESSTPESERSAAGGFAP